MDNIVPTVNSIVLCTLKYVDKIDLKILLNYGSY